MRELLTALFCLSKFFILTSTALTDMEWSDVILVQEGTAVTLPCSEQAPKAVEKVTWMMMTPMEIEWTLVFSVNINREMAKGKWRKSKEIRGRTLEISEDISLQFTATVEAGGRYSCVMEQRGGGLRKRIIALALVKLTQAPATSILRDTTVRLQAEISPSYAIASGAWFSPNGASLLTDATYRGILFTKLPRVTHRDSGLYTCSINVAGRKPVYNYTISVTVNDKEVAPFPNIIYEPTRRQVALSYSAVTLHCPLIFGDFVRLFWWCPDDQRAQPELIFQFDRWRNSKKQDKPRLKLLYPSSSMHSRNFSFLLKPELMDAGRYQCEVFLDDRVYGQSTTLTVLHGYVTTTQASINLNCAYAERSQVTSVQWSYLQNPTLSLLTEGLLGRIATSVHLPITPETAGQYVCTLKLQNMQVVRYLYTIAMATTEPPCCLSETSITESLLPATGGSTASEASVLLSSLSLLLFLVPVAAVAVGVLLWRRRSCATSRNVELTLSHYSGEVENIYENPEDHRQLPPSSAVYMDLKPTSETNVYRELDRYDQCCG